MGEDEKKVLEIFEKVYDHEMTAHEGFEALRVFAEMV